MNKFKNKNDAIRVQKPKPALTGTGPSSRKVHSLAPIALILLAAAGTYAGLHFYVLARVPNAMVGTWVVVDVKTRGSGKTDDSLKGGRLEFHRNGTMIGKVNMDGKEGTIKASVEVEGDILRITSVNPKTGQTMTDVQTIRTLEGDRFVIENHQGTVLMMERLRE
jgi:hypothetical protein